MRISLIDVVGGAEMMPDREKILADFEYAVRKSHGEGWDYVDGLTTENGFKILQLLKERESVVRCKDCIHFVQDNIPTDGCGFCELLSRTYSGNDYCSYGERRTDDA